MTHPRLRFAAARGARIQELSKINELWWEVAAPGWYGDATYRIHPSDAHLEYGPLSSGLIEDVVYEIVPRKPFATAALRAWEGLVGELGWPDEMHDAQEPEEEMYWLFAAEFLADEGM